MVKYYKKSTKYNLPQLVSIAIYSHLAHVCEINDVGKSMPLMWTNLLVQRSVLSHTSHVSTPDGYCSKYHSQDICILTCCIACIAHSVNLDIDQRTHDCVCTNSLIITLMEGPKLQNNSFQYKTNL